MMGRCKPYLGKVDSCIFELISTVQAYPSLYNKADPGYKKSRSNNVIWEAIGFLMKQDAKWCKTNWLYYQEEFRRNSKAIQPYHKALLFLNDFNDSETTARATKIIVHVETTPHWFENVGTDVEIIFKINKNTKMRKIMKGFYDRVEFFFLRIGT
ncbi:hypothetical protein QYM36_011731 [Artemia franciscana]|uniref:MADF domain-containing protein n=1 Tax=Artemia franciscana TaxID=6661 RepID=A0AA88HMR6_ARTSF|nr:hypothetical protein QYM36_011731 [Artemia franciscana]